MQNFESFNLDQAVMKAVIEAGFKEPSPIQLQAIPLILDGHDMVAQAQTGTGKTAAFALPTLSKIDPNKGGVQVLVVTPTRELATQVSDEIYMLGKHKGFKTVTVYGGSSYSRQLKLVESGASVIVATPGRMLDLLKNNKLRDFKPSIVILDEADEMLDMGFLDDIKEIFSFLPKERQTMLFSATMPEPIKNLAKTILNNPQFVSVTPANMTTNADIEQVYYVIEEWERDDAVIRLLDSVDPEKAIMFCRTKKEVDTLVNKLTASGYAVRGLHGDMEQPQREEVIKAFRNTNIEILIATDVAARGLNVKEISHVINVHIPFDPESYVHRIGRTGRAGKKGMAITLCTPMEYNSMQRITKKVGTTIELRVLPTKNELQKNKLSSLSNKISHAPLNENATAILSLLEEETDLANIALKAISILLEQEKAKGPEKIGIDEQTFTKMIKRLGDDRNRGRDRNRSRRPRSSDSRRDGGRDNRGGGSRSSEGRGAENRGGERREFRSDRPRTEGRGSSEGRSFGNGENRGGSDRPRGDRGSERRSSEGRSFGNGENRGGERSDRPRGDQRRGSSEGKSFGGERGERKDFGSSKPRRDRLKKD